MAFITTLPMPSYRARSSFRPGNRQSLCDAPITRTAGRTSFSFSAELSSGEPDRTASTEQVQESFLFPKDQLGKIVRGTRLENKQLCSVYSSQTDGFSNEAFFERQIPLGGVPSLLLGITESGILFGGYTANGFAARDDYRETSTHNAMFVFTLRDGDILVAEPTDLVLYDFFDYAVRFGSSLLGIPMNPAKHVMKSNMATSSCRLPDGSTSLFGEYTMTKLEAVQVLVSQEYVTQLNQKSENKGAGFFGRLFG